MSPAMMEAQRRYNEAFGKPDYPDVSVAHLLLNTIDPNSSLGKHLLTSVT